MADTKNVNAEIQRVLSAAITGMQKAATMIEADTKLLTHVQTGALRRSWTHDVSQDGNIIEGVIGSNLEYAKFEDDYHGNLSVAFNNDIQKAFQMIADEIKK